MPTTQIPRGADTKLFLKKQASFKTPATGDYLTTVAYSDGITETQSPAKNPLLGLNKNNTRDMTSRAPGLSSGAKGALVVPLCFSHMRYWLELLLGAPVTTGTDPDFVHTFNSGGVALPEATIETQQARNGGTLFWQKTGIMLDKMTIQASRQEGFQRVTFDCVGYGVDALTATGAGTPVDMVPLEQFAAALPVYKMDGVALGRLLDFTFTYANNLSLRDEIGDARPGGFDIDEAECTATMKVRLTDKTLWDAATAGTPHAGELLFQKSASRLLSLAMPIVTMEKPQVTTEGPGFIDVSYSLYAEQSDSAPALTATLKSGQETF